MTSSSSQNDRPLLAAALSAILGKNVLPVSDNRNVSTLSLFDHHLTAFSSGKTSSDTDDSLSSSLMTLNIVLSSTSGETYQCEIEKNATGDRLKRLIYDRENILCANQNLIYCGEEVDDGKALSDYGISNLDTIHVRRLRNMPSDQLVLDLNSLDEKYNYDFTNIRDTVTHFVRGGVEYRRPCGWKRFAIRVIGKYENEEWLGCSNGLGEWPVSYHGTRLDAAKSICQAGFDLSKHVRHLYGSGVYSTPDVNIAKQFTKCFKFNNQDYYVVLQNRVNPKTVRKLTNAETKEAGEYWITPDAKDIRPYGICIMKK
ncbi:unnamed protein product [Didymodactylos carnosus]|uniref:Ubiquitin-like domain-containing protein n=1 Tax=Didymodactylos carnosus TaxID=1234261 RepID=A0A814ZVD0_9BILA|nr:unnamed protein product [Didymodactylos carnosus]CAF4014163.1 unnamed protein product [Didymodactylos carnosus]